MAYVSLGLILLLSFVSVYGTINKCSVGNITNMDQLFYNDIWKLNNNKFNQNHF